MKKIGIIGGMSYESTKHYYERINKGVNDRLGGQNIAEMIIYSVNFEEIETRMNDGRWDEIEAILVDVAKKLELIGADTIFISTNTLHKLFYEIQSSISVPIIHIADPVSKNCLKNGVTKVGLLGTKFTMTESFLKDRLASNGLEVISLTDEAEINEIHRIIFNELCKGTVNENESKKYYLNAINKLRDNGAEGVILGCTEIEMLIKQADTNIPLFDTTDAHIEAAIDYVAPKVKRL